MGMWTKLSRMRSAQPELHDKSCGQNPWFHPGIEYFEVLPTEEGYNF